MTLISLILYPSPQHSWTHTRPTLTLTCHSSSFYQATKHDSTRKRPAKGARTSKGLGKPRSSSLVPWPYLLETYWNCSLARGTLANEVSWLESNPEKGAVRMGLSWHGDLVLCPGGPALVLRPQDVGALWSHQPGGERGPDSAKGIRGLVGAWDPGNLDLLGDVEGQRCPVGFHRGCHHCVKQHFPDQLLVTWVQTSRDQATCFLHAYEHNSPTQSSGKKMCFMNVSVGHVKLSLWVWGSHLTSVCLHFLNSKKYVSTTAWHLRLFPIVTSDEVRRPSVTSGWIFSLPHLNSSSSAP